MVFESGMVYILILTPLTVLILLSSDDYSSLDRPLHRMSDRGGGGIPLFIFLGRSSSGDATSVPPSSSCCPESLGVSRTDEMDAHSEFGHTI